MELGDRLDRLAELKEHEQKLKRQYEEAKSEREAWEQETYETMRESKNLSIRRPSGQFAAKSTVYGAVQDAEAFTQWVRDNDLVDEFIVEKAVGQRLNEYVRDALDNGADLPPGVTWYPREYVSVTRS